MLGTANVQEDGMGTHRRLDQVNYKCVLVDYMERTVMS